MTAKYLDPNSTLDYTVDWAAKSWLQAGETISTSVWIVPSGVTASNESKTATTATVWLTGGSAGRDYRFTNRITTSAGRTEDRSFTLNCRQR